MNRKTNLLMASLVAFGLSHQLEAASLEWKGSTTGLTGGASNTWDSNTTANWWDGALTVNWPAPLGVDDDAVFAGTAGTVTLTTATANDLLFSTTGYTITGGTLTLNGGTTPTITNGSGIDATISSIITGSVGLTKKGNGTLTLSGANSYTGSTDIDEGTVIVQNNSAFGTVAGGSVTVKDGAALKLGGTMAEGTLNLNTKPFSVRGTGVGGTGVLLHDGPNAQINAIRVVTLAEASTFGGSTRWDIRGAGSTLDMGAFTLTKTGTNYLAFVGASPGGVSITNPGNVVIDQGELNFHYGTTLGASKVITVNNGATFSFYQNTGTHSSTLNLNSGSTLRGENGSGAQNTWAGPVVIAGEVTLRTDGVLTVNGGITGTGNLTKINGSTCTLGGTNSFTGNVTVNAGTMTMNGINTFAGTTTVNGGTLALNYLTNNNSKLHDGSALILGGGALTLAGNAHTETVASVTLSGTNTITATEGAVLQMNTITANPGASVNFSTDFIATTDNLNTSDILGPWATVGGTTWATNSSNAADGDIVAFSGYDYTSDAGLLDVASGYLNKHVNVDSSQTPDGPISVESLVFNTAVPATLTLQGNNPIATGGILVASAVGANASTLTGGTILGPSGGDIFINQNNATGTLTINSVLGANGTNNLVKAGPGALILGQANTYTGTTTIAGGSLQIDSANGIGGTQVTTSGVSNAALLLGNNIVVPSGKSITIAGPGANAFYGALSTPLGYTGTSEWHGPVTIGALTNTRLGAMGGTLIVSGDIGESAAGSQLNIRTNETVGAAAVLRGNNTFSGGTNLVVGTLRIGSLNALGTGPFAIANGGNAAVLTADGATPRTIPNASSMTGNAVTLGDATNTGKLTFSNTFNVGTGARTVSTASEVEISGTLTGSGNLTKTGAANLILSNANANTGQILINAGTLVVAHKNALATSLSVFPSTSNGSGILRLATDESVVVNRLETSSSNPGTIVSDRATSGPGINHNLGVGWLGANTYTLSAGANVTSGTAGITFGSLNLTAGSASTAILNPTTAVVTVTGPVNIGLNNFAKTLRLDGSSAANLISGVISNGINTLSLVKAGASTWTLSGSNTFTGTTTLNGGTLKLDYAVNNDSKLADAVLTLSGGTLELAGGTHTESVLSTTLGTSTATTITRSSGSAVLQMNAISRSAGSSVNFASDGIATTDTLNGASGILGAWARVGGVDWAINQTNSTDGVINAYAAYTLTSVAGDTAANYANQHMSVDSSQSPGALITPHSLRFHSAGAHTLTLTGANSLSTGGILVTSAVGANVSTITGGTLTGPNNGDLIIHQDNTAAGLTIASDIVNTGTTNVVKTGAGLATLSGNNTYTGTTTVAGGTLTVSGSKSGASGAITVSSVPGVDAVLNIENGTYALAGNNFFVGFAQGTPATGTVNQSGGAVTFIAGGAGNGLLLGNANVTASTGIYNLSGGYVQTATGQANRGVMLGTNSNSICIFNLSGTGELRMNPTTGGSANAVLQIGRFDAGANNTVNTFTQSGGTANVAILSVGGNGGTGTGITSTMNFAAGVFLAETFPRMAAGNTNTAMVTIGGAADVTLPAIPSARGTGSTATVRFDGGTLKPFAAAAAYLAAPTIALVQDGGAKFDVATGKDITISQNLLEDGTSPGGGLTKDGVGTLTLTGVNTYTGDTVVNAGTLSLGNGTLNSGLANAADVVVVGATAILNLNYSAANVDTVETLTINGVQKAAGVWGGPGSGAPNTDTQLSGTGYLLVNSGPSASDYDVWAGTTHGLTGGDADFDFDFDKDGMANGLEWILGAIPTNGASTGAPESSTNLAGDLILTFTREENSIAETTLKVQFGTDLDDWSKEATVGATSTPADGNGVVIDINTVATPDEVTVTIPAANAAGGKLFGRLQAEQLP